MQSIREPHDEFKTAILHSVADLYRFAVSICHDTLLAEDLVSETVLKALENKTKLRDQTKLKPWMLRMMVNTFIDQKRKAKRINHVPIEMNMEGKQPFSLYEMILHPNLTDYSTPETQFFQKLNNEKIQQAIQQLPDTFRIAFVLCDIEELSYQEIATTLSIKVGTVRSRIARARSMLQQKLWQQAGEAGIKIKTTTGKAKVKCDC